MARAPKKTAQTKKTKPDEVWVRIRQSQLEDLLRGIHTFRSEFLNMSRDGYVKAGEVFRTASKLNGFTECGLVKHDTMRMYQDTQCKEPRKSRLELYGPDPDKPKKQCLLAAVDHLNYDWDPSEVEPEPPRYASY